MNDVINAIKSRRSVRKYRPDKLKKEEIDAIVEAGIYAPSGHNDQGWHFTVIQDRGVIGEINVLTKETMVRRKTEWIRRIGANPAMDVTYGAPMLIIVSARRGAVTPAQDCAAAVQNMMLAAESLGIGSCWMGFIGFSLKNAELLGRLGVPAGYAMREAVVFGYPAEGAKREAPKRKQDVVNYIGEF